MFFHQLFCVLCPAEQLFADMKAAFLVSSSGIHYDFEALYLGISSVGFSIPSWLKAVTAGASIQGPWSAAVTATIKLLCLQTLLRRPLH